jgi:GalNAc-alpha-(1->4)-GalNAc-alpha-(1->3)-diNAcBac-PP-undecaprenol alpha-1,4-N-acetyl-D-galactosaminyltransferase
VKHDLSVVIADMGSGGAQRVVSLLVTEWVNAGLRVALITMSDPSSDFFIVDQRVTRISLGGLEDSTSLAGAVVANRGRIRSLRNAISDAAAPVVVSFVGATNILTILAARPLEARVVISERNDPARQRLGRGWDLLRKLLYRRADVVTANSEGALRTLRRFVPARKLRLVSNPVAAGGERNPESHSILFVGRLVPQKGVDVLLDAMDLVRREIPDARLTIAGAGELEAELKQHSDRLGLEMAVRWLGVKDDLTGWWKTTQVFVLPSRFEGTPNALLEAMAWGIPCVVTTGVGGALDLMQDGRSGRVVESGDATALASAIVGLLSDPAAATEMGEAAREMVKELTPPTIAGRWLDVLNIGSPERTKSEDP